MIKVKKKKGKKTKITRDHGDDNNCFYISDPAYNQGDGHWCTHLPLPLQLRNRSVVPLRFFHCDFLKKIKYLVCG